MIKATILILIAYLLCVSVMIMPVEGIKISAGEFFIITFLSIIANILNSRIK